MVHGYPNGIKKKDIPYEAQIVRVADEYDAIVTKRQYTTHVNISETLKDLIKNAKPDPKFVALDQLAEKEKVCIQNAQQIAKKQKKPLKKKTNNIIQKV